MTSFSTLCLNRSSRASSREVPGGAVTSGASLVMTSRTGVSALVWKRQSRWVRMPTTVSSSPTIGRPEMFWRAMISRAWAMVAARRQGHRVEDHAVRAALDLVDLADLSLDGEVAVDDPQASLAGEGHGELPLGHRVHRRRDERDAQGNVARDPRAHVDVLGENVGAPGLEQDVVEGQSVDEGRAGHGAAPCVPFAASARVSGRPLEAVDRIQASRGVQADAPVRGREGRPPGSGRWPGSSPPAPASP